MKVLEQCCSTGGEGEVKKIMILQKSKWKMHSNESVRTMLLHRGGGGEVKKMIVQKSKLKMHSNESVRTMLLHRGGGGGKKNMIVQKSVENAFE